MTRNLKGFGLTKFGVRCDTVLDEDGNPVKVTQDILSETDQYYHQLDQMPTYSFRSHRVEPSSNVHQLSLWRRFHHRTQLQPIDIIPLDTFLQYEA
jgi:hypothetical protein